ncbi:MAG: MFS transporter [Myxococcales bacterium]|nr:MFS transporter [Myxococcales bacterium]
MTPAPTIDGRRAGRRLALFVALVFATVGVYLPYWPLWLADRGLDEPAIGLLLALGVSMRVLVGPLLARAADRRGAHARLLGLLSLGVLIGYIAHLAATTFTALVVLAIVCGAFWAAIMPICDSLVLLHAGVHDLDYGRIRRWGSVAFLVTTLSAGFILRGRSPSLVLWLILTPLALMVVAAPLLPSPPRSDRRAAPRPISALLRLPWLVIFCGASALVYASHGVLYGFATIHWRSLGISEDRIGLLWTSGVLAEIALFSVGARLLTRLRPLQLALLAALASVVRWLGLATVTAFAGLLALQSLHALSFGAIHLAAMAYLHRSLPPESSATAQSLFAAATSGLGFAGGFFAAGALYGRHGGDAYLTMAALAGAAALILVVVDRRWPAPRL